LEWYNRVGGEDIMTPEERLSYIERVLQTTAERQALQQEQSAKHRNN
jgi:hypothetical protein